MRLRLYAIAGACVLLAAAVSFALIPKSSSKVFNGICGDMMGIMGPPWGGVDTRIVGTRVIVSSRLTFLEKSPSGLARICVLRAHGVPGTDPSNRHSGQSPPIYSRLMVSDTA